MLQKISFLILIFVNLSILGQEKITEKIYNNSIRMNYMNLVMPNTIKKFKESNMGIGGIHYQLPFYKNFYVSGGMYYALFGDQGGLFTLGTAVGFNKKIYKDFYIDGNFHFGGGGGYRVLINDGSYINTNIGIEYKKKDYAIGVQYSYFDFVSGSVKDQTIGLYIQIPNKIYSTTYKHANKIIHKNQLIGFNRKPSDNSMIVRFDFFKPIGKSRKDIGTPLKNNLSLIGFEYQKHVKRNMFLYVHTDAIYRGLRAGFMDLFIGYGIHPIKTEYLDLTAKFGLGSAGGRVYPEGGITMYPSIGIDLKPFKNITLATHLGYFKALDGDLEAKTYGIGLKYSVQTGGTLETNTKTFKSQGFRVSLENQTYSNIPKTDDLKDKLTANLQLIGVNLAYDFGKHIYGFGEAGFAYKERSGGYAHGMIGTGIQTSKFIKNTTKLYTDMAIGVAGGGGIDTKEGIVMRPSIGISYNINDSFSIKTSYGRFLSLSKKINTNNFNIGLSYNVSFLKPN